jgi:hypothetical protein
MTTGLIIFTLTFTKNCSFKEDGRMFAHVKQGYEVNKKIVFTGNLLLTIWHNTSLPTGSLQAKEKGHPIAGAAYAILLC